MSANLSKKDGEEIRKIEEIAALENVDIHKAVKMLIRLRYLFDVFDEIKKSGYEIETERDLGSLYHKWKEVEAGEEGASPAARNKNRR